VSTHILKELDSLPHLALDLEVQEDYAYESNREKTDIDWLVVILKVHVKENNDDQGYLEDSDYQADEKISECLIIVDVVLILVLLQEADKGEAVIVFSKLQAANLFNLLLLFLVF